MVSNPLAEKFGEEICWVNWKLETLGNGKQTKIPYLSKLRKASSTNPKSWRTYEEVSMAFDNGSNNFSGVGIVLHNGKVLCIDIDHVLVDGKIVSPVADIILALLKASNTFTEISQSGTGLHIFFELDEPFTPIANKSAPFEIYSKARFIATTNNSYHKVPLSVRTVTVGEMEEILKIIGYPFGKGNEELSDTITTNQLPLNDSELLERMFSSKNGEHIKSLYNGDISAYKNDTSSADSALCFHLAFWTRKDHVQMERIWLASPLGQRVKTQKRKDYVTRTITNAIKNCDKTYEPKVRQKESSATVEKGEKKKPTKDISILKYLFEREDIIFFHDEKSETYIYLEHDNHTEIWPLKSKAMRMFLNSKAWSIFGETLKSEEAKNILGVLQGKAYFEGPEIKLHNRVAWREGKLCYDLTNDEHQIIEIDGNGWNIIDKAPILFKRYTHHKAQVIPVQNGDIKLLLKYVNIGDEEHLLLFFVLVVSYFIPDFPHAMMVLFGAQGASKTTTAKIVRLMVDPSIMEVSSLASSIKELVQELAHHHFIFFDNISYISEEVSDILCKAISGGGFTKRELYTDDEDIIYVIQRCVAINGINLVTTRPDLLDRSVLLELLRIDPSKRKSEKELYDDFEKDLPSILGGIFDVLTSAIKRRSDIKVKPERMADFTYWGCAIAEALGYTKEDFLKAYRNNTIRQTEMLLNDNVVATAIIKFMEDKGEWKNTPTKLLDELYNQALFANIDTREKYWPKGASALSRRLNELSTSLKQMGISVVISTHGTERYIHIQKVATTAQQISPLIEVVQTRTDDTDDISPILSEKSSEDLGSH